jgi:hypothetical protein
VTSEPKPQTPAEEPVRVKLYGLMSVTRRGYRLQLIIAGVLLFVLMLAWLVVPLPRPRPGRELPPRIVFGIRLWENMPWIVLGIAILYSLEAFLVLRRFREKESARQQQRKP